MDLALRTPPEKSRSRGKWLTNQGRETGINDRHQGMMAQAQLSASTGLFGILEREKETNMNEMTLNAPAPHLPSTVVTGIKMAVFAILVLALSPFVGFWIVALVGAALFSLPVGAIVLALFPRAFRQVEDHFLS